MQGLARKFLGSGGVVNADFRVLCAAELSGQGTFEVDEATCTRRLRDRPRRGRLAEHAGGHDSSEPRDHAVGARAVLGR